MSEPLNPAQRDPLLDVFIFETVQLLEQLEQLVLDAENQGNYESSINEVFRIMHTIKGSAAMMRFDNLSSLAHAIEDLFFYLREEKPELVDYHRLCDLILAGSDFIKTEIAKIQETGETSASPERLLTVIQEHLAGLKKANPRPEKSSAAASNPVPEIPEPAPPIFDSDGPVSTPPPLAAGGPGAPEAGDDNNLQLYKVHLFFESGAEMEDIRAFAVIHELQNLARDISFYPEDIATGNGRSCRVIREAGFKILFRSDRTREELRNFFDRTILLKEYRLSEAMVEDIPGFFGELQTVTQPSPQADPAAQSSSRAEPAAPNPPVSTGAKIQPEKTQSRDGELTAINQKMISVNVAKLDNLMDLVGELVIAEAMVTRNPELEGLHLDNFFKAARQLRKIASDLQDVVMAIRMVPLTSTFQKMNRLVRDMGRSLQKEVKLEISGAETEVDKNIIEHLNDPLMHLIRNSVDHGIEPAAERVAKGKPETGTITLEAKNTNGEVWIMVRDDGRGLDRAKILAKAKAQGLLQKPESELSDKEIDSLIFLPGFSTNDRVTEYSGRGVGMDVVMKNIQAIGGSVLVDSNPGMGITITLKIPLTLAIIDGMTIKVGKSRYTVPTVAIIESMKIKEENLIIDPDGNEMLMVRGECYPVLRLNRFFRVETTVNRIEDGIIIMVENEGKNLCLFADALLGEQQVVVKAMPAYIKKVRGISGCTLLGDGSISLILDIAELINLLNSGIALRGSNPTGK